MTRKRSKDDSPRDSVDDDDGFAQGAELEGPSRSARKRASHELKGLGVALTGLSAQRLVALRLPEPLHDVIVEARRLTSFGAQRRQAQYIGKLMRRLDEETLAAVRAAVHVDRAEATRATALLHRVERWRDSLLADDDAIGRWLAEFPATDAQQLRALIRQARKDARVEERPGAAPRRGRAYRQIFALVRAALVAATGRAPVDQ
jgi:ribosome-associated protein